MRTQEDIKEIIDQIKCLILANREMGLDPPPITKNGLELFDGDHAPTCRSDHLESLEALKANVGDCRICKLHKSRTLLVFGEGNPRAKLVFVGEGPGKDEDLAGRPFVGEAGKLLTRIITNGMGLTREDVYICNVVKCRPPGNRDPERDEIEACLPFLQRQIDIIRPKVICALGRVAAQTLIGGDFKITRERGKWRSFMDIPLMPTFHPAYVLRNPSRERQLKGAVWEDIKQIMTRLGLEVKKNG